MKKVHTTLAAMMLLASACAGRQSARFLPVQASGVGGQGYPAAQHDVQIAGAPAGHVSVWSPGVYPPRPGERPIVHVALHITNQGRGPMQLDMQATTLGIATGGRRLPPARPYHVAGNTTVAPGQAQRVDLYYALPGGVSAYRVEGFNQSWGVQTSAGQFRQDTPFSRYRRRRVAGYWRSYFWHHWPHHRHHWRRR